MTYYEFMNALAAVIRNANAGRSVDPRDLQLAINSSVATFAAIACRSPRSDFAMSVAQFSIVKPELPGAPWFTRCSVGRFRFGPSFAVHDDLTETERARHRGGEQPLVVLESEACPRDVLPADVAALWVGDNWRTGFSR